jgi:hypothetical protein
MLPAVTAAAQVALWSGSQQLRLWNCGQATVACMLHRWQESANDTSGLFVAAAAALMTVGACL